VIAFTGEELFDWVEETSNGWKRLISLHPEILSFPCDIRESEFVAQLLQHIVAIELRFAERLSELPETSSDSVQFHSVAAIYCTHDHAMGLLRPLINRDHLFWETVLEMKTKNAGVLRATRRAVLAHLLTHSIRHYAQLATLVRKHGVAPDFAMDNLVMRLIR
jgi:uncharacterized damage-inducible protein DinB